LLFLVDQHLTATYRHLKLVGYNKSRISFLV
jgi:uncharacterized protein with PIN domain